MCRTGGKEGEELTEITGWAMLGMKTEKLGVVQHTRDETRGWGVRKGG